MLFRTLTILTTICAISACNQRAASTTKLINGEDASAPLFESVISFGICTGILINDHMVLTAAHCVHNFSGANAGTTRSSFLPGKTLQVSNAMSYGGSGAKSAIIEMTHIHPTWLAACTKEKPCSPARAGSAVDPKVADIAVITLRTKIEGIRPARLDVTEVKAGDPVFLTGYGCMTGTNTGGSNRKKFRYTKVADGKTALAHAGSQRGNVIEQTLSANFVTPGYDRAAAGETASLCKGDSGGPVLRVPTGVAANPAANTPYQELSVVGVNADYTFTGQYEAQGSVAKTNIHTRFDNPVVYSWLKDVVKVPVLLNPVQQPVSSSVLFVKLENAAAGSTANQILLVSAPTSVEQMRFCWGKKDVCTDADAQTFMFAVASSNPNSQRKIFKLSSVLSVAPGDFTLSAHAGASVITKRNASFKAKAP